MDGIALHAFFIAMSDLGFTHEESQEALTYRVNNDKSIQDLVENSKDIFDVLEIVDPLAFIKLNEAYDEEFE